MATLLVTAVASMFIGCSDGSDELEDTCNLIVNECNVGSSVGDCIDRLGDEGPGCLACIKQAKCSYPSQCDFSTDACRLPAELLPPP